jgi:hypothetical protein
MDVLVDLNSNNTQYRTKTRTMVWLGPERDVAHDQSFPPTVPSYFALSSKPSCLPLR